MELKFELRSKTPSPEEGKVNLRFVPAEGGPSGDLTLDGVPEADAARMLNIRKLAHDAIRTGRDPEAVLRAIRAQAMDAPEPSNPICLLSSLPEKSTVTAHAGADPAPA